MSIIIYGSIIYYMIGERWTAAQRAYWILETIPSYILGVIVGLLLSDGYLQLRKGRVNARLGIGQSLSHFEYVWFVFSLLSHFCESLPHLCSQTRKGSLNHSVQFLTRSLPVFTTLYRIFYLKGVKVVPHCIYELLTPVALAHWIMGDGTWERYGLVLCTDSFTVPEVVHLMNVLRLRYSLECTLRKHQGNSRIYIRACSIPRLRSIVLPYVCPSMLYRLGL